MYQLTAEFRRVPTVLNLVVLRGVLPESFSSFRSLDDFSSHHNKEKVAGALSHTRSNSIPL
jgi:hypothetical protein